MSIYHDRHEAGQRLALKLEKYQSDPSGIVLGLPRGGVPVAYKVAQKLNLPLDVFIVRKLGVPGHKELAMGAIASGGKHVFNSHILESLNIKTDIIDQVIAEELKEIHRREQKYLGYRQRLNYSDKNLIVVDDGLATGATMRAAVMALRQFHPKRIIVAVPAASVEACEELSTEADEVICAATPDPFFSVGYWYHDFAQTSDEEVAQILKKASKERPQKEKVKEEITV